MATSRTIAGAVRTADDDGARLDNDAIVAVDRAFLIVERLADAPHGMSLADLTKELGVNKGMVSRLVSTLTRLEIIWRDDRRQLFFLTYRVSNLGLRHLQTSRLLDQCAGVIRALAERSGELVRLAMAEPGFERLTWVYSASGTKRTLQIDPNYSLEISLYSHAIGKAWLSTMPFPDALRLMQQQGMAARTPHSKTSIEEIKEDLELGSRRGYSCSFEENEIGINAIAAPIFAPALTDERRCVGAVSVAAPDNRMPRSSIETYSGMLLQATGQLGRIWPMEVLDHGASSSRKAH